MALNEGKAGMAVVLGEGKDQPPPRSGHRNCRNVPERFAGTL